MSNTNIYGLILAGGSGKRMDNIDKPKQYLEIGGKPILIHTVEHFLLTPEFEEVIVLCSGEWMGHTRDLIRLHVGDGRVLVEQGGDTRNETIMNGIQSIEQRRGIDRDTIIVTHDAVRPFVSRRIIEENIACAKRYGACDTVIPAADTIVRSKDQNTITDIPLRKTMFQGQTPQSFRALELREVYRSLTSEERQSLTDACKIMTLRGKPVHLVRGETYNIKITYPSDLRMANALLKDGLSC